MKTQTLVTLSACLLMLSACQWGSTNFKSFFSGATNAGPVLTSQTVQEIEKMTASAGCASIEHLQMKVTLDQPTNGYKGHVWGRETWLAFGCEKTFSYDVVFSEDGYAGNVLKVTAGKH